jgi:hypothetical protein
MAGTDSSIACTFGNHHRAVPSEPVAGMKHVADLKDGVQNVELRTWFYVTLARSRPDSVHAALASRKEGDGLAVHV